MLSILIPTYRYDCRQLVDDLHVQCETLGIDYEIIVADDGSGDFATENASIYQDIDNLSNCRTILRKENVGRSRIRNVLMDEAKGELLLFMDQDGKVIKDDFIEQYIAAAVSYDVVCGGIIHTGKMPSKEYCLRYLYEKRVEKKYANTRNNLPFRSFCFLIRKEVAANVRMDERYEGYGYEDVKYGIDLRKAGYKVGHINNPLMNDDIEENRKFVEKTEEALRTLHVFEDELRDETTITRTVSSLRKYGLLPFVKLTSKLISKPIRNNLCSTKACINLFNLYKLFYYLNIN